MCFQQFLNVVLFAYKKKVLFSNEKEEEEELETLKSFIDQLLQKQYLVFQ